ncbi:hypothetical protein EVG20_g5023 [Dentipellis fragilis]|uniref:Uncharacterized protein n=1 Tax=Dentipellis fragilis TaxID=205917 RepID=A0A4Y9YWD1_9AGAM|nr:hypothetical protein EVG20_g5023 [Dentipellis fragilis]
MVEPISKFAIRLTDLAAGATVSFVLKHRPKKQMQAGDDYLERALDFAEGTKYVRNAPDTFWYRFKTSHNYKKQAKEAYSLTRELSNLRRESNAFAVDIADAIVAIAERDRVPSALDENADLDELRLAIVDSIESSLEDNVFANYNASYTSVVNVTQMAENVWATPELAELRSELSSE